MHEIAKPDAQGISRASQSMPGTLPILGLCSSAGSQPDFPFAGMSSAGGGKAAGEISDHAGQAIDELRRRRSRRWLFLKWRYARGTSALRRDDLGRRICY